VFGHRPAQTLTGGFLRRRAEAVSLGQRSDKRYPIGNYGTGTLWFQRNETGQRQCERGLLIVAQQRAAILVEGDVQALGTH
jgi:hypothetical protein